MSSAKELFGIGDLSGQPRSFWEKGVEGGSTRAHIAAIMDVLPDDFEHWDIVDKTGMTVAHMLVATDLLPVHFDQWSIMNREGEMVAHVAALKERLAASLPSAIWALKNREGETVAHSALERDAIPSGFQHWNILDRQNETLSARIERLRERFPKSLAVYQSWRIQNAMDPQKITPAKIQRNSL